MVTGWVSEAWPLVGFLRHGNWVGFRGMAAGWVTGWVSEAWSQDGFLRHGHCVGFRGMAAGWVSEAWPLGAYLDGFLSRVTGLGGFQTHCCWVGHLMGF